MDHMSERQWLNIEAQPSDAEVLGKNGTVDEKTIN